MRKKGSVTVEASLLMPLILSCLILVIYLSAYRHNRVTARAICQETVYAGIEAKRSHENVRSAMEAVLNDQSRYLFFTNMVQTECSVKMDVLSASIDVTMDLPMPFIGNYFAEEIVEKAQGSSLHPVTVLRMRDLLG